MEYGNWSGTRRTRSRATGRMSTTKRRSRGISLRTGRSYSPTTRRRRVSATIGGRAITFSTRKRKGTTGLRSRRFGASGGSPSRRSNRGYRSKDTWDTGEIARSLSKYVPRVRVSRSRKY